MIEEPIVTRLTPPAGERDHSQGPATAPVTLVEYGDYECPYCGEAHEIVRQLQERLGRRLQFVFRQFPLADIHPHAEHAAEAAEAAGAQGKFWEMHDLLYENQGRLDDRHLAGYARELGLDLDRFVRDVSEHRYAGQVQRDVESGIESQVQGTPTFFINGVRYEESWDGPTLLAALEQAAV
jgi:protein-disulfide isomerase